VGADLTAAPVIRPYREADDPAVGRLLSAAFGGGSVADLAGELRDSDAHRAALVAELDNDVAGIVQLSRGWLDTPARLVEVLVLSPLGVLPELQGRGIGAALVRAAIETAERLGSPLLFLEGSPRYYPRFGFSAGGQHGFRRPSQRIPEPAFQVVLFAGWQDWMVGALIYPDAFWRHDAVGLRGARLAQALDEFG
jgi:putative acetyltransferase